MRKICFIISFVYCSLLGSFAIASGVEEEIVLNRNQLPIEEATKSITQNKNVLDYLFRQSTDKAFWSLAVADKIADQSIAVIKLMAATNVSVEEICPRPRIELNGYRRSDYVWSEVIMSDIAELRSFALLDRKEENIRAECLEANERALAVLNAKKEP